MAVQLKPSMDRRTRHFFGIILRRLTHNDRFGLEALEPRVLLSADPTLLSTAATIDKMAGAGSQTAIAAEDHHAAPITQTQESIAYSPYLQLDAIFAGSDN